MKDSIPIDIHIYVRTYICTYVCMRTCMYQVATVCSGTMLWRAKAGGTAKYSVEAVARGDGWEEETWDVYVILILHVCNKHTNVLVSPYFRCVREEQGMMLPGKKEDSKEDAWCQHDCEIAGVIRDFPDLQ